jgi:hypothetical protein
MVDLTYLKNNVFAGESGGDYNALYGYANRGSGPFGGVNVTDMTINQVLDFTDPRGPYAQSVKGQIGRVATPTGAYQVVGSTLRDAVRGLGLTGNERYDAATQDRIGQWIYENQGPQAWEGWGKTGGGGGDTSLMGGTGNDNLGAGMEPEQTGLLGFLGNDEKRARLSLALSGLSMFPNQAAQQMALNTISQAQQGRLDQQEQAKTQAAENRTLQYIANLGTPQAEQALAYAQGTGDVAGALKMAMQTANPMDAIELEKAQLEVEQLRNPQPDLPASVDEYQYAVSQGYKGTFQQYQQEMAAASRAQTNVTVGGETGTLSKKLDEAEAATLGTYLSAGTQSAAAINDLQALDEVMTMAPQGIVTGRFADMFQGVSSAADAAKSIIKRVAPTLRAEGSGSTSDIEYNGMLQSLPSLINSPEANRAISAMMKAKAQINVERAQIVRAFQNSDRSPEATAAMRAALGALDSRSIMTPELRAVLGGLSGAPAGAAPASGGGQPVVIDGVTITPIPQGQ